MARHKHFFFYRSEYQHALHNYRKARRRGDVAQAQRWVKLADMHLRVADRFDDGVYKSRMRDAEIARAHAAAIPKPVEKDELTQLQELEARMMADLYGKRRH